MLPSELVVQKRKLKLLLAAPPTPGLRLLCFWWCRFLQRKGKGVDLGGRRGMF